MKSKKIKPSRPPLLPFRGSGLAQKSPKTYHPSAAVGKSGKILRLSPSREGLYYNHRYKKMK